MSENRQIVIATAKDCRELANSSAISRLVGSGAKIELRLPFDYKTEATLQNELDKLANTCGCIISGVAMLSTLCICMVAVWLFPIGFMNFEDRLLNVGLITAMTLCVGGIAKVVTLRRAQGRLRRLLYTIGSMHEVNIVGAYACPSKHASHLLRSQ